MTGAVERVRPKMMTVIAITVGTGTGSEVVRRIAADGGRDGFLCPNKALRHPPRRQNLLSTERWQAD